MKRPSGPTERGDKKTNEREEKKLALGCIIGVAAGVRARGIARKKKRRNWEGGWSGVKWCSAPLVVVVQTSQKHAGEKEEEKRAFVVGGT
jgi:hypothetical protein